MFARLVTFKGAKDLDSGLAFLRDKATPVLHEQKGYRGLNASADRTNGVLSVLSIWDTEAERDASEGALARIREEGGRVIGGQVTIEHLEEAVVEVGEPPTVGSRLLLRRISMDPAKVDENLQLFRREALPQIKAGQGFRAVRVLINRETGEGIVGTVWSDDASRERAAEGAESRRERAERQGVAFGEQSRREIAFSDLW